MFTEKEVAGVGKSNLFSFERDAAQVAS